MGERGGVIGTSNQIFFPNLTKNMMEDASQGIKLKNKNSAENDLQQLKCDRVCA